MAYGTRFVGRVHTMNSFHPERNQLVVGPDGTIDGFDLPLFEDEMSVITLPAGAVIVPGLHDAHTHWGQAIFGDGTVSLEGVSDLAEAKRCIKAQAERQQTGWILVIGWNSALLAKSRVTQAWLDKIVRDRKCMVLNRSFHEALVSSSLERVLLPTLPSAYEGEVANGYLQAEPVWMALGAFQMDRELLNKALIRRQNVMFAAGFTSIAEKALDGTVVLNALRDMYRSGELFIPCDAHVMTYMLRRDPMPAFTEGPFRVCGIKQVMDGAFGNCLACIAGHGTYPDGTEGRLLFNRDQLLADTRQAVALGYDRLAAHCIGTGAISETSAAFMDLLWALPVHMARRLTFSFEHFETPSPLVVRGVASLQHKGLKIEVVPTAGFTEDRKVYADRLPREVLDRINPYAELMSEGVRWREGTDGIITGDNPWWGMAQAMGRDGSQAITFSELFARYIGEPLTVGRPADFVVLDSDPFADTTCLKDVKVLETWIAGRKVWSRPR